MEKRHFGFEPKTVTLRGARALSEEGQFVEHLREGGELVSLKDLVECLHARCRIVDPVDVVIEDFDDAAIASEVVLRLMRSQRTDVSAVWASASQLAMRETGRLARPGGRLYRDEHDWTRSMRANLACAAAAMMDLAREWVGLWPRYGATPTSTSGTDGTPRPWRTTFIRSRSKYGTPEDISRSNAFMGRISMPTSMISET